MGRMKIDEKTTEKLGQFAKEAGIKFIVLFGSQTKGLVQKDSDFDIAVLTAPEKNIKELDNYNNVLFGLSKILNIPDYKMDLTNLNNANPFLKYQIVSEGNLLYGDENKFKSYKLFSIREYMDMSDLRSLEKNMILKRQKLLSDLIYVK